MSKWKLVPVEPTPEMADAGAQRLASWEDGCEWPESWSPLQVAAMRNQADRAWRSMWLAAAPSPEWVYDRFPTREEADEGSCVWFYSCGRVVLVYYEHVTLSATRDTCWMPKPSQQPPEPPALQERK